MLSAGKQRWLKFLKAAPTGGAQPLKIPNHAFLMLLISLLKVKIQQKESVISKFMSPESICFYWTTKVACFFGIFRLVHLENCSFSRSSCKPELDKRQAVTSIRVFEHSGFSDLEAESSRTWSLIKAPNSNLFSALSEQGIPLWGILPRLNGYGTEHS